VRVHRATQVGQVRGIGSSHATEVAPTRNGTSWEDQD
jgi:hypothetical protein